MPPGGRFHSKNGQPHACPNASRHMDDGQRAPRSAAMCAATRSLLVSPTSMLADRTSFLLASVTALRAAPTHAPSWLMAAIIKTRKTRRWLFEQARRWWRRTVPSRLALHQGCPPPPTGMGRGGKTGWCFWGHARRCPGTRIPRRAPPSPPIKRGAAPAERSVNPPAQRKGQAERLTCYAGRMFCID